MSLRGWIFRWRMRFQIGLTLVLRYLNPWDSFFRHPIVFDIWSLAMDSEAVAEMVDQELLRSVDADDTDVGLLTDDEDPELTEVLAAAGDKTVGRSSSGGPIRVSPRAMSAHVRRWKNADQVSSCSIGASGCKRNEPKSPGVSQS